ncbi:hypothetical protein AALP_AA6G190600 [Arabis alpina]|uniref:DUF6821 domain-containing protein n=1 Tax=Arabis alpina TaxID=50452 RepID=A0A087GQ74_ARAAL|nr:hypothetical protein AALP_AA6G190600 [Arabis alpina]
MEDDWELLHGSDTESTDSITSDKKPESSSVIDDGMILSHHFSVRNPIIRFDETTDPSQYGVVEVDGSFRLDYGSNHRENLGEVRVDSSSGHLDVYRSGVAHVRNEIGLNDFLRGSEISGDGGEVRLSDFEATEEKHPEIEAVTELAGGTVSHYDDVTKCFSDSGGNEMVYGDSAVVNGEAEIVSDSGVVVSTEETQGNEESKSRETVWWKMPFVLLKYSAFRIGPVWSVSIAAALMGFVLLGRRLYNMKKKAQRFNLKVTIDDKKVSRVMSQAARLNEVFTEVRRVPVIPSALPSPGTGPLVLSLR